MCSIDWGEAWGKSRIKAVLVIIGSIMIHGLIFVALVSPPAPAVVSSGAFSAPVSLKFAIASPSLPSMQSEASQVEETETPDVVEVEPPPIEIPEVKTKPAEKTIAVRKPVKKPVQKKPSQPKVVERKSVEKKLVEKKPVTTAKKEPAPAIPNAAASTPKPVEQPGLSEIPVVTNPAFRRPPSPPDYPRKSRRRNQQGVVLVEALVSEDGTTLEVDVLQSSGYPLLDRAAIKAVSGWDFMPRMVGSKAVISKVQVPVQFSLRNS